MEPVMPPQVPQARRVQRVQQVLLRQAAPVRELVRTPDRPIVQ